MRFLAQVKKRLKQREKTKILFLQTPENDSFSVLFTKHSFLLRIQPKQYLDVVFESSKKASKTARKNKDPLPANAKKRPSVFCFVYKTLFFRQNKAQTVLGCCF